jgi:hypothetical protein
MLYWSDSFFREDLDQIFGNDLRMICGAIVEMASSRLITPHPCHTPGWRIHTSDIPIHCRHDAVTLWSQK